MIEKQIKYFTCKFKKAIDFGKLYLLPKIHERPHNVQGRSVISNCETPTEKCFEFLDHYVKPIIHKGKWYIKYSGDSISKTKSLTSIAENAFLVIEDIVGVYPSTSHEAGLRALRQALDKWDKKV